jgi:SAM-dependent methyltransferase
LDIKQVCDRGFGPLGFWINLSHIVFVEARPHRPTFSVNEPTQLDSQAQTLASFDWQWANLPTGDFMPGDPWFDANASRLLAEELCGIAPQWFEGRTVLDAGCGQGRWTRALLELGARVTAVDYSEAGLARTRELCAAWPTLETERVNLLALPEELARRRFDLVYSFGVLHHTGDTNRALDNIATLVNDRGALVLYLYGAASWTKSEKRKHERLRRELATLTFEQKIEELRRRFPHEDPHQLFDLLSPTINDRVEFEVIAERLRAAGFERISRTIESGEVFLRALRRGFPEAMLREPVLKRSEYWRESARRWLVHKGIAFEDGLRVALASTNRRSLPGAVLSALRATPPGARVLDASLPPDRISAEDLPGWPATLEWGDPRAQKAPANVALWLGASLGASRFPDQALRELARRVVPGGTLIVELVEAPFPSARRTWLDKVLDARVAVPTKLARLLERRREWCTGEGLSALGGSLLLNPLTTASAQNVLSDRTSSVEFLPGRRGTRLLVARALT